MSERKMLARKALRRAKLYSGAAEPKPEDVQAQLKRLLRRQERDKPK